jgi:hypothetical protein
MMTRSLPGRALATGTLITLLLALTGCGFIFSHAPPPGHEQMTGFTCSTDNTPATLDILWGGLNVVGAVIAAAEPESVQDPDQVIAVGLGWGVLSTASAISGFSKTKECRSALAQLSQRQHAAIPGAVPTLQTNDPAVVEVTPPVDTLQVGERVQLQAMARGSDGIQMPGRTYVWSSSNDAIESVNAAGNVFANATGSVVIAARTGSVVGTAKVVVVTP